MLPVFGGFPFSWYLVGSMLIMLLGLVVYRLTPEIHPKIDILKEEGEEEGEEEGGALN